MKELVRKSPRISVNKLGEYAVTSNAVRRERIVSNQRKPRDFIVPRYTRAENLITDFIARGCSGVEALLEDADRVRNADSSTEKHAERNRSCSDAIVAFSEFHKDLDIQGCEIFKGERNNSLKLNVAGIGVNVRPEVLLKRKERKGEFSEGAIKLYISKSAPMTDESGLYVATMLHRFVEEFSSFGYKCNYRYCYVVDVFAKRIYEAPKSFVKRRKSIEAACGEIGDTWRRLSA